MNCSRSDFCVLRCIPAWKDEPPKKRKKKESQNGAQETQRRATHVATWKAIDITFEFNGKTRTAIGYNDNHMFDAGTWLTTYV
eukprot:4283442-Pyramimonas_sp.AAC.1